MKAISLWQPWASAMAVGLKTNETRSWPTTHRGELAICAAKRTPRDGDISAELAKLLWVHADRFHGFNENIHSLLENLPYGTVVCVVNVFDCTPVDLMFPTLTDEEILLGDYSFGRFAWQTRNCRPLDIPVPVIGRQGFFNLPQDVEEKVRNQL